MNVEKYRKTFERYLKDVTFPEHPENLYTPVRYALETGGKRIRPVLTMIATEGYGKSVVDALPAASTVEIFHNFTLLHDDVMDHASLRRGKETVHKKWNKNIAMLSGDVMIFIAQKLLEVYPPYVFRSLQSLLNQTAMEICEGQQMDMDFEESDEVALSQYMEMIKRKTAVLLGTSLQYGAIIAEKNAKEQYVLYEAGVHLGEAFQIADDYLDTFGDQKFGKEKAGDIKEGKKTYLYVKLLEKLKDKVKNEFVVLYNKKDKSDSEIKRIIRFFSDYGIPLSAKNEIQIKTQQFINLINSTMLDAEHKKLLINMAEDLSERVV